MPDQTKQQKIQPVRKARSRPSHPDELPSFDILKAARLTQDLGPADVIRGADKGPEVQLLQKLLILAGYELAFSGEYDQATFEAVRKLQRKQQLLITGKIDARSRDCFNGLLRDAQTQERTARRMWYLVYPYRKQKGLPIEAETAQVVQAWLRDLLAELKSHPDQHQAIPELPRHERPLLQNLLGPPGQQGLTTHGVEVARLQEALTALGYPVKVNHSFDLQTFNALRKYQSAQGLTPHGITDPLTRARINPHLQERYEREKAWEGLMLQLRDFQQEQGLKTAPALEGKILEVLLQLLGEAVLPIRCELGPAARSELQSLGPDVLLLKCFLIQQGHALEPDLSFDSATATALRSFQKKHKLPLSGYLDAKSLDYINQLREQQYRPEIPEPMDETMDETTDDADDSDDLEELTESPPDDLDTFGDEPDELEELHNYLADFVAADEAD